ncbi:unnamed protein product [Prorocentrum cordatum]|uniref:Uncharacterized protein n=1 Tax=Prorocentrum cordatum TaxID=2364126 RepID=A0ABN9VMS8_9DINO|nr:unnamed protein product [Polarella glacialis]|mmetsp:Transcript_26386/g.69859  ORF Transcript_26386/g.69859 Transcript_26386/m.69859 type:complete len:137 (+) Transcript_26386:112-522(+)
MPELKDYVYGFCMCATSLYSVEMLWQAKEAQTKYLVKGSTSNEASVAFTQWFGAAIGQIVMISAAGYLAAHKAGADSVKNAMGVTVAASTLWSFARSQKSVQDGVQKPVITAPIFHTTSFVGLLACFLPGFMKDLK